MCACGGDKAFSAATMRQYLLRLAELKAAGVEVPPIGVSAPNVGAAQLAAAIVQ